MAGLGGLQQERSAVAWGGMGSSRRAVQIWTRPGRHDVPCGVVLAAGGYSLRVSIACKLLHALMASFSLCYAVTCCAGCRLLLTL